MSRIRHLPAVLVQGMADPVCPPEVAQALARAWPEAQWSPVAAGGHGGLSSAIAAAVIEALAHVAARVEMHPPREGSYSLEWRLFGGEWRGEQSSAQTTVGSGVETRSSSRAACASNSRISASRRAPPFWTRSIAKWPGTPPISPVSPVSSVPTLPWPPASSKPPTHPITAWGKKVRTVQEALLLLGLKSIVRTIAGLSLQGMFKDAPRLERFWDVSAKTACLAGWLAQKLRSEVGLRPEDAYTFGLFRDCGIPLLMIPFPEYEAILKVANADQEKGFTQVEDELLSINHAVVGAELAEGWLLPGEVAQAIQHHHDPVALEAGGLDTRPARMVALGQLAEHILFWNGAGQDGRVGQAGYRLPGRTGHRRGRSRRPCRRGRCGKSLGRRLLSPASGIDVTESVTG